MLRLMVCAALLAGAAAAFAAPQATQHVATDAPSAARRSPVKPGDRDCIRDTGSRIPAKKGECLPVTGRSYTKQDLDATGERTLGPALQRLDPAVTVHGSGY
jgi:hypothetical protein